MLSMMEELTANRAKCIFFRSGLAPVMTGRICHPGRRIAQHERPFDRKESEKRRHLPIEGEVNLCFTSADNPAKFPAMCIN
ncbi:hypothetical protein A8B83_07925 [Rhodobacteraceae bacterium EhC02]|nr:hypothetical protein A8B83_07925 [Rhodobacteraceae bacterium EhC02]